MKFTAEEIIKIYDMVRLPDGGGYYAETYRSPEIIPADSLPKRYEGSRHFSSVIHYLITQDDCLKLHSVASDEVYFFHFGAPVDMLCLLSTGISEVKRLGSDIDAGCIQQIVVPAGTCKGAELIAGGEYNYALLSCTAAPGFEFADYHKADYKKLIKQYPDAAVNIRKLT